MADRSNPGFRPLASVLSAEARRLKVGRSLSEEKAVTLWPEVVGAQIAGATEADQVRDGVLYVIARTHTWAFELTFHREQILAGLNSRLGSGTIKEIRFRTGVVGETSPPPPPPEPTATPEELAAITLEPGQEAAIEQEAAEIADPQMQAVVRRLLVNQQKRTIWQQQHGLRPCSHCGAMHSTPGDLCPVCRTEARR